MWKTIPNYLPRYEVSDDGQVRSLMYDKPRIMRQYSNGRYLCVDLRHGGRYVKWLVHRLVAHVYIGPCPEGMEVCHNDGNPINNHVSNLRYDTRSNNHRDKVRHGTHNNAIKTHCPKGHEYSESNTYINPSRGNRQCRLCKSEQNRRRYHEKKHPPYPNPN